MRPHATIEDSLFLLLCGQIAATDYNYYLFLHSAAERPKPRVHECLSIARTTEPSRILRGWQALPFHPPSESAWHTYIIFVLKATLRLLWWIFKVKMEKFPRCANTFWTAVNCSFLRPISFFTLKCLFSTVLDHCVSFIKKKLRVDCSAQVFSPEYIKGSQGLSSDRKRLLLE